MAEVLFQGPISLWSFSVYREVLTPEMMAMNPDELVKEYFTSALQPGPGKVAPSIRCDGQGNVLFYSPLANGGYGRETTNSDGGTYVCLESGSERKYVHRAQLFTPTAMGIEGLGTQAILLAFAFQGMRTQLDCMMAYIRELSDINAEIERLRDAYAGCLASLVNLDPTNTWAASFMPKDNVDAMLNAGLLSPDEKMIVGVRLQPVVLEVEYLSKGALDSTALQAIYYVKLNDDKIEFVKAGPEDDWSNWGWNRTDKSHPQWCNRAKLPADGKDEATDKFWVMDFDWYGKPGKEADGRLNDDKNKIIKFLSCHEAKVDNVPGPYFSFDGKAGTIVVANSTSQNDTGRAYSAKSDGQKIVASDTAFGKFSVVANPGKPVIWSYMHWTTSVDKFDALNSAVYKPVSEIVKDTELDGVFVVQNDLNANIDSLRSSTEMKNGQQRVPSDRISMKNNEMQPTITLTSAMTKEAADLLCRVIRNISR
ncbi:MAG: hypothetical protein LBB38_01995 [Puniceicoccales bacterium]|nr:hypothetical protein [Puniceicoccales bacterium]